jgi:hypothetical protein
MLLSGRSNPLLLGDCSPALHAARQRGASVAKDQKWLAATLFIKYNQGITLRNVILSEIAKNLELHW